MADTDVLPYDYVTYAARSIPTFAAAKRKAATRSSPRSTLLPPRLPPPLAAAAAKAHALQIARPSGDLAKLNQALRQTETALISEAGLPNRPWYRHTIYAPGEFTGYAAVVIPGVNEAIDAKDYDPRRAAVDRADPGPGPRRANQSARHPQAGCNAGQIDSIQRRSARQSGQLAMSAAQSARRRSRFGTLFCPS
jgi:hypothetical protein